MCDDSYDLLHYKEPPFVIKVNGTHITGLVYEAAIKSLRACCTKMPTLRPIFLNTQEHVLQNVMKSNSIALPISLTHAVASSNPTYFIRTLDSPGMAMLSLTPNATGTAFYQGLFSIWPLFVFIVLVTGYAGLLLWTSELFSKHDNAPIPKGFITGYFESCYCALITATTVGYGDTVPKTTIGKCFVMLWIFFGLTIMSVFTASMTTILTSEQVELNSRSELSKGTRVGVFNGSIGRQMVIRAGAFPVELTRFEDLHKLLHDGSITGILINQYLSAFVVNHLPENFDVDNIISGIVSTGFIIYSTNKDSAQLRECMRNYLMINFLEQDYDLQQLLADKIKSGRKPIDMATSSIEAIVSKSALIWLTVSLIIILIFVALIEKFWKQILQKFVRKQQPQLTAVPTYEPANEKLEMQIA